LEQLEPPKKDAQKGRPTRPQRVKGRGYVEGLNDARTPLADIFSILSESGAFMTETCYAKGQKVILVTSQIKSGKWLCKFSIPGSSHLDDGLHSQNSSKGYNTEWEARTNAFQRAKLLLGEPADMT
jgi:hypothetical protein